MMTLDVLRARGIKLSPGRRLLRCRLTWRMGRIKLLNHRRLHIKLRPNQVVIKARLLVSDRALGGPSLRTEPNYHLWNLIRTHRRNLSRMLHNLPVGCQPQQTAVVYLFHLPTRRMPSPTRLLWVMGLSAGRATGEVLLNSVNLWELFLGSLSQNLRNHRSSQGLKKTQFSVGSDVPSTSGTQTDGILQKATRIPCLRLALRLRDQ